MDAAVKEFLDIGGKFKILRQHGYYMLCPVIPVGNLRSPKAVYVDSEKDITDKLPQVAAIAIEEVKRIYYNCFFDMAPQEKHADPKWWESLDCRVKEAMDELKLKNL